MYRGYSIDNLSIENLFKTVGYKNVVELNEYLSNIENNVHKCLDNIYGNNVLNGELIMQDWFPNIDYNVFISHSHKDIKLAKEFASWLYGKFRITSFIDSCVWGYSDKLLKLIDDMYCMNKLSNTYNYKKRNFSTSHVHMMLMTAINKMIDKTECVIFLNTSNSNICEGISDMTLSPWIYGEIETTRTIRKILPERIKTYSQGGEMLNENLNIKYKLDTDHLNKLNSEILIQWNKGNFNTPLDALDELYKLTI